MAGVFFSVLMFYFSYFYIGVHCIRHVFAIRQYATLFDAILKVCYYYLYGHFLYACIHKCRREGWRQIDKRYVLFLFSVLIFYVSYFILGQRRYDRFTPIRRCATFFDAMLKTIQRLVCQRFFYLYNVFLRACAYLCTQRGMQIGATCRQIQRGGQIKDRGKGGRRGLSREEVE